MKQIKQLSLKVLAVISFGVWLLFTPTIVYTAGLNNRSLSLSTSKPSVTSQYLFGFDITSATQLGSIVFEFCAESPLPQDPCTSPTGFSAAAATLDNQSGEIGFTIDGSSTQNRLVLTRIPSVALAQASTYEFNGVTNPSTPSTTSYVRLSTYATTDASGPVTEENGIAFAITDDFTVSAFVPPFLQFCVGLSITGQDCDTATGSHIDFGILEPDKESVASSQMAAATNGVGGVSISLLGTTMTSGINSISALSSPSLSIPGTSQFGINLRDNSSPDIGEDPSGSGSISPVGNYNLANLFTFNNGDVAATSGVSTEFNTLTVSYLVNVSDDQAPGVYTSTITFVATATF